MTCTHPAISRAFLTLREAVAVQAIKGVPSGTNAHSSAREPNNGLKSLFLKKNLKFLAIVFYCFFILLLYNYMEFLLPFWHAVSFIYNHNSTLNKQIACGRSFLFYWIFFKMNRSSIQCFGWCPPNFFFFYAMDFGSSEHSKHKLCEVYILSGLSWSTVSLGLGLQFV